MSRFRPPTTGVGALAPYSSRVKPGVKNVPVFPELRSAVQIPSRPALRTQAITSPVGGLLTALMGIYILLHLIPGAELINRFVGVNLLATVISGILLSCGVLFSGQISQFWKLSVSRAWIVLLGLFLIAGLTGTYPRGSVTFIAEYAIRFHTIPFLICAVAQTGAQVRKLMYWGGGSGLVALLLTFLFGQSFEGRLEIPDTTLGNPNDLALTLLLCGLLLMAMLYSKSIFVRLVPILAIPISLYYILQTGSRANFLTIVLVGACIFFSAPAKVKFKVLVAVPILAVAMIALVPTSTLDRLTAIFVNPIQVFSQGSEHGDAVASQIARTRLQERALDLTLRHPLLGVGALEFAVAIEQIVRDESGQKSTWQNAHNVYLQVAAENGIPAILLFAGTMFWALRTNYRVYKLTIKHSAIASFDGQSLCLLLLVAAYSFGICFGNYMYDPIFPILVGLTAANQMSIQRELAFAQNQVEATVVPSGT